MASVSQSAMVRRNVQVTGRGGLIDKYFYFAMSLLVAGLSFGDSAIRSTRICSMPRCPGR